MELHENHENSPRVASLRAKRTLLILECGNAYTIFIIKPFEFCLLFLSWQGYELFYLLDLFTL
jgi:hypothetical protein